MPSRWPRALVSSLICLTGLTTGCSSMRSAVQHEGTADASAGQSVASTRTLWGGKKEPDKPSPKLMLAYGKLLEDRGTDAGARKQIDAQRAAYAAARRSYEQVLSADEKSVDATIGVARLDQVAGRTNEAEQGFLKAVRLDPRSSNALDALGQFYTSQSRWNEALGTFQRAMEVAPENSAIRFHHAVALARSGQLQQAFPILADTVGKAAAHYNVGLILHERGDLAASEQQFEMAIYENPRLEQAQVWLREVRREQEQMLSPGARTASASHRAGAFRSGPRPAAFAGASRELAADSRDGQIIQASAEEPVSAPQPQGSGPVRRPFEAASEIPAVPPEQSSEESFSDLSPWPGE